MAALPPRTPNYGKTPKYIQKYRREAKAHEQVKQEEKAARMRPKGTRVLEEVDRIATLEVLHVNKKKIMNLLMQMPISMRTENLKK